MLQYENIVLGDLFTNCYIVWDDSTKAVVVIDPADSGVDISELLQSKQLNLVGILATHGHFDHLLGALDLKLIYNVPFYCSSRDQFLLDRQKETAKHFLGRSIAVPNFKKIDVDLDNTEEVIVGKEKLTVMKTPGHTPGSVCFYNQKNGWLFSGDTLFANGVGRTDTSYGNKNDLQKSLEIIERLPSDTEVLSGHGERICLRLITGQSSDY